MRWVYFQQAMIPREEAIVWQAEVSLVCPTNQKTVVLVESKDATFVGTRQYFEVDLHCVGGRAISGFRDRQTLFRWHHWYIARHDHSGNSQYR